MKGRHFPSIKMINRLTKSRIHIVIFIIQIIKWAMHLLRRVIFRKKEVNASKYTEIGRWFGQPLKPLLLILLRMTVGWILAPKTSNFIPCQKQRILSKWFKTHLSPKNLWLCQQFINQMKYSSKMWALILANINRKSRPVADKLVSGSTFHHFAGIEKVLIAVKMLEINLIKFSHLFTFQD